jgi:hypothetical protein
VVAVSANKAHFVSLTKQLQGLQVAIGCTELPRLFGTSSTTGQEKTPSPDAVSLLQTNNVPTSTPVSHPNAVSLEQDVMSQMLWSKTHIIVVVGAVVALYFLQMIGFNALAGFLAAYQWSRMVDPIAAESLRVPTSQLLSLGAISGALSACSWIPYILVVFVGFLTSGFGGKYQAMVGVSLEYISFTSLLFTRTSYPILFLSGRLQVESMRLQKNLVHGRV